MPKRQKIVIITCWTAKIHPDLYLGRNSVMIERFGGRVTAPIKSTTFGCCSLSIIFTYIMEQRLIPGRMILLQ